MRGSRGRAKVTGAKAGPRIGRACIEALHRLVRALVPGRDIPALFTSHAGVLGCSVQLTSLMQMADHGKHPGVMRSDATKLLRAGERLAFDTECMSDVVLAAESVQDCRRAHIVT